MGPNFPLKYDRTSGGMEPKVANILVDSSSSVALLGVDKDAEPLPEVLEGGGAEVVFRGGLLVLVLVLLLEVEVCTAEEEASFLREPCATPWPPGAPLAF